MTRKKKKISRQPDIPFHLSPFKIFKLLAYITAILLFILVEFEGRSYRQETWRKWKEMENDRFHRIKWWRPSPLVESPLM